MLAPSRPLFIGKRVLGTAAIVAVACFVYAAPALRLPSATARQNAPPQAELRGELVYVPIYSSVYYENGKRTMELAATLSIHNVNPDCEITVLRASYYDTEGKLIKEYVTKPTTLNVLQTTNIVIDKANKAGGTGANFLVSWQARPEAVSPMIEAVMVNAASNLGIAFTTSGKVIRQITSSDK